MDIVSGDQPLNSPLSDTCRASVCKTKGTTILGDAGGIAHLPALATFSGDFSDDDSLDGFSTGITTAGVVGDGTLDARGF